MISEEGSRELVIGDQKVIQDTVLEWKWLPTQLLQEQDILSLAELKTVKPRRQFWKGVQFVDFWDESFPYQYTSTINHLKENSYNQYISLIQGMV